MRTYFLPALLGMALMALFCAPSQAPAKTQAQRMAELIAMLGSAKFQERDTAIKTLEALGPSALPALEKAAKNEDVEIRRRAEELVRKIEKRLATAKLLRPNRVHLVFNNKTVPEAIAEFSKLSGVPMQIEGDASKLANRRMTLETGDTTFWEAFDKFCAKAGVIEKDLGPQNNRGYNEVFFGNGMMQKVVYYNGRRIPQGQIFFADGKPPALPTFQAGSIRIRGLPPKTQLQNVQKAAGEILFGLEVAPEPRLIWQGVVATRIDKALDDQGQSLKTVMNLDGNDNMWGGVIWINMDDGMAGQPNFRQLPIRLKQDKKPSKILKELAGRLSAQVQSDPEPLVTVQNILAASNKTFTGKDDVTLKVMESKRPSPNQVQLRVQVEATSNQMANMWMWGWGWNQNNGYTFRLEDAEGEEWQGTNNGVNWVQNGNGGFTMEYHLTYQAPAGDPKDPIKFAVIGRRTLIIDIPFQLKDVALP